MKSIVSFLSGILIIIESTLAQAPLVKQWDARFGGTYVDQLSSLQQTTDGGYILGGFSFSGFGGDKTQTSWGYSDYWMVKIDSLGNKQWDKRFGGTFYDLLFSLQQTIDGGYILGGHSRSNANGDKTQPSWSSYDYWLVKTDSLGNKQWDKRFGGTEDDELTSLQQTTDGGYILGGYSLSDSSGDKSQPTRQGRDYWVVKTDSLGNKQWDKRFGGIGDDELYSLQQTTDEGYILGGRSGSPVNGDKTQPSWGGWDFWIVKIDSAGNMQWDKDFGGAGEDGLLSLQQTTDGGYILGGYSSSGISGDKTEPNRDSTLSTRDYWIVKIDSVGNKKWDKGFGGSRDDDDYDSYGNIFQTTDGGYLKAGTSYSNASGDKSENNLGAEQTWIVKTDSLGNKQWDKTIFTPGHDEGSFAIQTNDGGYAIANYNFATTNSGIGGYKTQQGWGSSDYWIVKFSDATLVPPIINTTAVSICTGESYFAGGSFQISSGTYYDSLTAVSGIDSIVITILSVLPHSFSIVNLSICEGESYFVSGANQTTSGVYYDTLNAANDCDSIITTSLIVLPRSYSSTDVSICDGESYFAGGADQNTSGTYYDTLIAASECDSVVITHLTKFSTFISNILDTIFYGDSILLGGSYQTSSGTYFDSLITIKGCDSVIVTYLTVLHYSITLAISSVNVTCGGSYDGSASVMVSGGVTPYQYSWSNGDTTATLFNLQANIYTVTVTDAMGQTQIDSAIISEPQSLSITTVSQTNATCFNNSNGSATVLTEGGIGAHNIIWSNGASGETSAGLSANTYTVTVTDSNNCTATTDVTIEKPAEVIVTTNSVTAHVTCLGASDGAAKAFASGGTPPYSFLWSDGQTTSTPTGFPAGTHSVTVTDSVGCAATTSITIADGPICTGINENTLNNISFHPNPTDGSVTLEIPFLQGMESLALKLYDALGKQVNVITTPFTMGNSKQFSFDIKDLPGNIFFLNITTDSGSRVMKVVKY